MQLKTKDPIAPWFVAAEELGEYIGIRFGRVRNGGGEPEWFFLRHTDYDGIGGLAELLRKRDVELHRLPQIKHYSTPRWWSLLRAMPKYFSRRHRVHFSDVFKKTRQSTRNEPPLAVGWHVFDDVATTQIRRVCRKSGVTVNSFLVKHLTKAIRPFLKDESSPVPWMIPVNLRGGVTRTRDTENHSSYVGITVRSHDSVHDVHRSVYNALAAGEHWANWMSYGSGLLMTSGMRRFLIKIERCMSQWNIGSFSNLGEWDSEKKLARSDADGPWLFCPPVLRCQLIGAGCVTFRNRLSLTIQAHPELTTNTEDAKAWVQGWVKEIEMDLANPQVDSVAVPWVAA